MENCPLTNAIKTFMMFSHLSSLYSLHSTARLNEHVHLEEQFVFHDKTFFFTILEKFKGQFEPTLASFLYLTSRQPMKM